MLLSKKRCLFDITRYFCGISFFGLTLIFTSSCNSFSHTKGRAYFDQVIKKIDKNAGAYGKLTAADIAYLDSAFTNTKGAGADQIANRYIHKSYFTRNQDLKFAYADSAITLLQDISINDDKTALLYAEILNVKGSLYFGIKNYDEAIRNFTLAKIAISKIKDTCKLYGYYANMANILYAQKKYLLAARFFQVKYLIASKCERDSSLQFLTVQENIDNTGICYFKANLTDSAAYYYNAALKYINESERWYSTTPERAANITLAKGVVYGNLADILFKQKKYSEAERLFLLSIESTKVADTVFTRSTRLSLAAMYIETNELIKAGNVIKDMAASLDSTQVNSALATFYKTCSDYYLKTNQLYAAHASLLNAYRIKDSLEKRDRQFNAIDVKREFENREQKAINQKLEKDNELKSTYLFVSIIVVAMGAIIILLVLMNLKRKAGYVNRLTTLNEEVNQKNDDLQKTLRSLEQSHKENNRIMRVMAHDLKNPISAIRTLAHSLLKKEQSASTREAFELIESACADSIVLIKDLLDNKRKLSDVSKELVDMGRLIEQCTELFLAKAEEKKQQLTLQLDHPVVMLNRQKMWRVISNIVSNAIKFSPENSEITIRLERHDHSVLLSVKDNGIGIPADLKDKVFMTDTNSPRAGTAGEESYGLGLSISRKIIEEHDGRLWFESEVGKGSIFYVELPYLN